MIKAVIGANYGDEGKGLAVNYLTRNRDSLVVRHNGGAQSGHTVEVDDKRYVFHEIGSGTFNGAHTFWDKTYHPDLYTFNKEYWEVQNLIGDRPRVYADENALITTIDDVFLNCFKESAVGHFGSCGMGIWECVCRNNAGYGITIRDVLTLKITELYDRLNYIRENYSKLRLGYYLNKYGTNPNADFYKEMLLDTNTMWNFAYNVKEAKRHIYVVRGLGDIIDDYDDVVFETGQGLLLDGDYDIDNGTPSKTGLFNIVNTLNGLGKHLDEAIYVTRTYLTRHGAGAFDNKIDVGFIDKTNVFNKWQGDIQYGAFGDIKDLEKRINADCTFAGIKPHLLVTHVDTTDGKFITTNGEVDIEKLNLEKIYVSDNRFGVTGVIGAV